MPFSPIVVHVTGDLFESVSFHSWTLLISITNGLSRKGIKTDEVSLIVSTVSIGVGKASSEGP